MHGARSPGSDDFDGSGTPAAVATEIAACINDPANAFAGHVTATASANVVKVVASSAGVDVELTSAPPGTTVQNDWRGRFDEGELGSLATWIGGKVGATYRIALYE